MVFTDTGARLSEVTVSLRDATQEREIPVFAWDLNEGILSIRMQDDGAAVGSFSALANALDVGTLPSMLAGRDQPQRVEQIAFRGLTAGFGAGTVFARALIYVGYAELAAEVPSSRGLPVPSW